MARNENFDQITAVRVGNCWHYSDGTVLPAARGGDGSETAEPEQRPLDTPEQIADAYEHLAELSNDDLARLEAALVASYQAQRETVESEADEQVLTDIAASVSDVRAEQTTRQEAAAEREERLAEADRAVLGESESTEEEGEGEQTETAESEEDGGESESTEEQEGTETAEQEQEAVAASATRRSGRTRSLRGITARQPARASAPATFGTTPVRVAPDVPDFAAGESISGSEAFGRALHGKWSTFAGTRANEWTKYPVMRIERDIPADATIPRSHTPEQAEVAMDAAQRRFEQRITDGIMAMTASGGADVRLAAGGPCAPPEQSFDVPFLASNRRPFTDAFASVGYPRGQVNFFPPLCYTREDTRTVTDGVTTSGSPTVDSNAANFTSADVGKRVTGTGIPALATIAAIVDENTITLSANATATATGVTLVIFGPNNLIGRSITMAQDTAGYTSGGGTTPDKECIRIDCPEDVTCELEIILKCITIGNWVDRAFPEYVRAWRSAVDVHYAERFERKHIAQVVAGSSVITVGTNDFGATRDALRRIATLVSKVRSARRLGSTETFRVIWPEWFTTVLKLDLAASFGGSDAGNGYANFNVTDAQIISWFRQYGINVSVYMDEAGPTTQGDLTVLPLPVSGVAVPFPPTTRIFAFREGAWTRGTGGTLDLGVVRDSGLNAVNDFQVFMEEWSKMCYRGCAGESYVYDMSYCYDGKSGGAVSEACPLNG